MTYGRAPSHDDSLRGENAKTTDGGTAPLDVLDYQSAGRYPPKKDPSLVVVLGSDGYLGMHLPDIYIIVLPFIHPAGVQVSIFDILCLFAIGCPLAFLFLQRLRSFQRVIHISWNQSI